MEYCSPSHSWERADGLHAAPWPLRSLYKLLSPVGHGGRGLRDLVQTSLETLRQVTALSDSPLLCEMG